MSSIHFLIFTRLRNDYTWIISFILSTKAALWLLYLEKYYSNRGTATYEFNVAHASNLLDDVSDRKSAPTSSERNKKKNEVFN